MIAMIELTSGKDLESLSTTPPYTRKKLRKALARAAQEYLLSQHQLYIARLRAAKELREFIYQLKHRPYTKRLFGFSPDHIKLWDQIDRKELTRERQQRFRAKKSAV
jgi:hypothetical protein